MIILKLREELGSESDELPADCIKCGVCVEVWNGSRDESAVNAEEVADSCPADCMRG